MKSSNAKKIIEQYFGKIKYEKVIEQYFESVESKDIAFVLAYQFDFIEYDFKKHYLCCFENNLTFHFFTYKRNKLIHMKIPRAEIKKIKIRRNLFEAIICIPFLSLCFSYVFLNMLKNNFNIPFTYEWIFLLSPFFMLILIPLLLKFTYSKVLIVKTIYDDTFKFVFPILPFLNIKSFNKEMKIFEDFIKSRL